MIDFFALAGINKHRVCGYLSKLKREGKIRIDVQCPGACSFAFAI